MNFLHSTEFYVVLLIAAAAIVAYFAIPAAGRPVEERLLGCDLLPQHQDESPEQAAVKIMCRDDRSVILLRTGLTDVTMNGAVSLKVEIKRGAIHITERLVSGNEWGLPAASAMTVLDNIPAERFALRYDSPALSLSATTSFNNTPGYTRSCSLTQ